MNNFFKNTILIIIGVFAVFWIIWARFIRERLPKIIPFDLTEFRFFILLYICGIYIFIIIFLLQNSNKAGIFNNQVKFISDYIYTPLKLLDFKLKVNSFTMPFIPKFLQILEKKLDPFNTKVIWDPMGILSTFYIFFNILPRLLLASLLLIDIFFFKKLDLVYNFVCIGVIPLIHRYGVYSLKNIHEIYEVILTLRWSSIYLLADEGYLINTENIDMEDEDQVDIALKKLYEFHDEVITPKKYLEIIRENGHRYYASPRINKQLLNDIQKLYYPKLSINEIKNKKIYIQASEDTTTKSIHFNNHIMNYRTFCYLSKRYSDVKALWYIKSLRIFAFSLYLFAWFSVLIKSLHTLENLTMTLTFLHNFSYYLYEIMNIFL